MSDSYAEVIVHDEKDIRGTQLKIGLIVLTIVLLFLGAMFSMLIFTLGVLMIPYTIVSIKNRYHEYEYLLVSEELDISSVRNRMKRKKIRSYSMAELQCMAPVRSHRLDSYHSNPQLKVLDYSSGNPDHDIYSMIFASKGVLQEVRVEPTQAMLDEVKMRHSSIVFTE